MRAKTAPRDLQGGKAPTRPTSGRRITIKGAGVPPAVLAPCGHAIGGKPPKITKPRGGAAIQVVEHDEPDVILPPLSAATADRNGEMGPAMRAPEAAPPDVQEFRLVALAEIQPSPTNPRKHFDEAELVTLTESLTKHGLIEPLVVRQGKLIDNDGCRWFELIAGERRYRAAKRAGLVAVPVMVRDCTDVEVLELQLVENIERQDLNAIEEAEAFERMITTAGWTQQQLADRIDKSQGHVANRRRMLELPERVKAKVISREIPPTHARALLPWLKAPAVVEAAIKPVSQWIKRGEPLPNLEDWDDHIEHCARRDTHPLDGEEYGGAEYGHQRIKWSIPLAERAALGVVELPSVRYGDKGTAERATNKKAWQAAKNRAIAAAKAKFKKRGDKKADRQATADKRVISPAERKKLDAQRARQLATRIADWRTNWLRELCYERLAEPYAGEVAMRMIIVAARADWFGFQHKSTEIDAMVKSAGITFGGKSHQYWNDHQRYDACRTLNFKQLPKLATALVKSRLVLNGEPQPSVEPALVEMLAADLNVELAKEWKCAAGTPRAEAFFSLHDKTQLAKLAGELKVKVEADGKRSDMIAALLAARPQKLPASLTRKGR